MKPSFLVIVFCSVALLTGTAIAQSKVDAPQTIRGRSLATMRPDQVRDCLFIAKDISDLTDRANVAKSRGDFDTFNATVSPYNQAIARWNAGCTKPYDPADMIRAENENGMRLCKFTSTPCMSETERRAVLAREASRQGRTAPAPTAGIQKETGRVLKKTAAPPVRTDSAVRVTGDAEESIYAWWVTKRFVPMEATYRGLPTRDLSTPLERMSVLSCAPDAGQITSDECQEIAGNHGRFRVTADINHDGVNEVVETGVATTVDGAEVKVLVISALDDPSKNQVFTAEEAGFSAIFRFAEGLRWYPCMECSIGGQLIVWDNTQHAYTLVDAEDLEGAPLAQ